MLFLTFLLKSVLRYNNLAAMFMLENVVYTLNFTKFEYFKRNYNEFQFIKRYCLSLYI